MKLITHTYSDNRSPTKAIIALHGWTGDEFVFEPVAKMLKIKNAKWFFPRAPYRAEKKEGNSWFSGNDEQGWNYSKTMSGIEGLLRQILDSGFIPKNIYIIGFSQGACLAMEYALRMPFSIGGIVPIAGFIKFKDRLINDMNRASQSTKVLLLHGRDDKIVLINESRKSLNILKELGYDAILKSYNSGHKIPISARVYIKEFID